MRLATALAHKLRGGCGAPVSGPRLLGGSRSRGDSVETEGERGRNAGSMKKGISCERKQAWISSGKAGAGNGFLMEVCVDSVESAVNAERGGKGNYTMHAAGNRF